MANNNPNQSSQATVQVVRAFIVCFVPDLVVGLQGQDGQWYLPGGIVEGVGCPQGFPPGDHYYPLEWYVRGQTGLELTGLSDALQMGIYPGEREFEATILYAGQATGILWQGTRLDYRNLPQFAPVCINPAELIARFLAPNNRAPDKV